MMDVPPPKKRILVTDASVMSRLTEPKLNIIVQQILKHVDELAEIYNAANNHDRFIIVNNVRESYIDECKTARRVLGTDEFIENIAKSIGWDFVAPDSPVEGDSNL